MIKNRIGIDEHPGIIDEKSRLGDWEGDTVIGKIFDKIHHYQSTDAIEVRYD